MGNFRKPDDSFFSFVKDNVYSDTQSLRLKYGGHPDRDQIFFAIDQIEGRRKFRSKLSSFFANDRFLLPSMLSGEQASHQAVAAYNASLIRKEDRVVDLTAGLGMDSLSLAEVARNVCSIEIDEFKADILRFNAQLLKKENLTVINDDCIKFLEKSDKTFDTAFIDPARRGAAGNRVYSLSDSTPDILERWQLLCSKTRRLLIKASPMIDIHDTLQCLSGVRSIHVVCVKGECKELLIDCHLHPSDSHLEEVEINIVDLPEEYHPVLNGNILSGFSYILHSPVEEPERPQALPYCDTNEDMSGKLLLTPNAGMMKAGGWNELAAAFPSIVKFSPNTHLFATETFPADFPGKAYVIEKELNSKELKKLKGKKMNVVCRNFTLSAPQLASKVGVTDGGEQYLVGCRIGKEERPKTFLCRNLSKVPIP
ncbi:MAG: class I SAM-dependent methyltransferase [Muribaculum sp.]|nr:class I SAM-dependent methyltransferase [Muribaculum sp.]